MRAENATLATHARLFVAVAAMLLLALNTLAVTTGHISADGAAPLPGLAAAADGDRAAPTETGSQSAAQALRDYQPHRQVTEIPLPVAIRIPAIDVESSLVDLGRDDDRRIEAPEDWDQAGWWTGGARPGARGPSVILGHVDSRSGPAVFFRLGELGSGDEIHVDRADGSTVTYVVERTEQHGKDDFPTESVYLPTLRSELRLVTCGGPFDRIGGSYEDNVIVFATAADS